MKKPVKKVAKKIVSKAKSLSMKRKGKVAAAC